MTKVVLFLLITTTLWFPPIFTSSLGVTLFLSPSIARRVFALVPLPLPCSTSAVLTLILRSSAVLLCNYGPMVAEQNIFLAWCNSCASGLCVDQWILIPGISLAAREHVSKSGSLVGIECYRKTLSYTSIDHLSSMLTMVLPLYVSMWSICQCLSWFGPGSRRHWR